MWNNFIWTISPATSTSGVNLTISDYTDTGSDVVGVTSSAGTIKFNTYYMDQNTTNQKRNTCIHELGHALGLKHRRELDSVMYKSVTSNIGLNEMDEWNYSEAFINY